MIAQQPFTVELRDDDESLATIDHSDHIDTRLDLQRLMRRAYTIDPLATRAVAVRYGVLGGEYTSGSVAREVPGVNVRTEHQIVERGLALLARLAHETGVAA